MARLALHRYFAGTGHQGPSVNSTERTLAQPRAYTHDGTGVPQGWQTSGLADWSQHPECIDGYIGDQTMGPESFAIYAHNHSGYVRYTLSPTPPPGWNDSTELPSPFGYIFDVPQATTTPLYQLSWWSSALRTHLQFLTTSPHEYTQALAIGWRAGVPDDASMDQENATLSNPVMGQVYPGCLQATITQGVGWYANAMRKLKLMEHQNTTSSLAPGECLELVVNQDYPDMKILNVEVMGDQPSGGSPTDNVQYYFLLDNDLGMNAKELTGVFGGKTWKVGIWQNGSRAVRIVQRGTEGAPIWYLIELVDGRSFNWVLDPEILDNSGGQQGPGWGGTAQS